MKRTGSLFHTIVIVGAALGGAAAAAGCSEDEHRPPGDASHADAPVLADARPADASPVDANGDARAPDAMVDAFIAIL
jgi:hypothetical protein